MIRPAAGERCTEESPMASGALVLLGVLIAVLGLFVGGNITLVVIGLLAILAGGVLQVAMMRRS